MKKIFSSKNLLSLSLSLLAFTSIFAITVGQNASACSIYAGDPEVIKGQIIPRLAAQLGVAATSITNANLTTPGISFLEGLGADCRGLDQAVRSSAYDFSIRKGLSTCQYKGVVIIKTINATTGEMFVNAEPVKCSGFIRPVLPINLDVIPGRQ